MSDESVRTALRSDAPLVIVEAPAGCGKTTQGAEYAREIATGGHAGKLLILTHTHAACSVFSDRTKGIGRGIEIRTIDGIIGRIASAYHVGLGLPADIAAWIRQRNDGHADLAVRVASLLTRHPMIAAAIVQRHPLVICDEHQDSSGDQHSVVMALLNQGARLRIFADPMQKIFRERTIAGGCAPCDWGQLTAQAQTYEQLDIPHRWSNGCPELGKWTLAARATLKAGGKINLRDGLPPSITVVFAENQSQRVLDYRLSSADRRPIDTFERGQSSLLVLTHFNDTARSLRGFFNRRILLWEGHTRSALEELVNAIIGNPTDRAALAGAIVAFMGRVGKGFSPSAFGDRLIREAREGCGAPCRGRPAIIQELAKFLVMECDHHGVAKMLRRLSDLKETDSNFSSIELDCHKEFWDAIHLGDFESVDAAMAEITHRRTYTRPKPPEKAISIIHKAKGLECDSVILMPCDSRNFPDKPDSRCLLYVALSRARSQLMLVVSCNSPSPLFTL
jgi:DNA helicase-2/ATP-dependent DNA helicase PcrA